MILIESEPPGMGPTERCCFCRNYTSTWTAIPSRGNDQVACCAGCASRGHVDAVPSKAEWCEREAIATPPALGRVAEYAAARAAYRRAR